MLPSKVVFVSCVQNCLDRQVMSWAVVEWNTMLE